jgi:hypothetical protein
MSDYFLDCISTMVTCYLDFLQMVLQCEYSSNLLCCCHMVQLVGWLLLELLVMGSKPSGVGLLLESMVGSWAPTYLIIVHYAIGSRKVGDHHPTLME